MRLRPLHEDFGVEVVDFDIRRASDPQELAQLREALDEHQLLLFRLDGPLTPEQQIEISSCFGPPSEGGDGRLCMVLHNEDRAGSAQLPFHSDFTYTDHPIKVISLQAIEVPPGGTETVFASGMSSWARLDPDLRDTLAPMTVRHEHESRLGFEELPEFIADHPIRTLHPRSGRPILFVTEHHARRIHELDADRSSEVLAGLFEVLYDPSHLYTHAWRLYDFVIWDNLALQHSRPKVADLAAGVRAVQRVAINEVGYSELIERAREQERQRLQTA
jgi:taurine dioxygenase